MTAVRPAASRRRLLAVGFAALGAACTAPLPLDAPAVAELEPPVPPWIAVRLSESDDGRRVTVAPGMSFAVSLRVPAEAGLGWIVVERPDALAMTGRTTGPVWPPGAPANPALPPPLWQVFVFEARGPLDGRLRLELRGPDSAATPRTVSFRLTPAPAR